MRYQKNRNERCLRGLQYDYVLERTHPLESIAQAVQNAFEGQKIVRIEEKWAAKAVVRLVIGFVMELRIAEDDPLISLIHRLSAKPEKRSQTEALIEKAIGEL